MSRASLLDLGLALGLQALVLLVDGLAHGGDAALQQLLEDRALLGGHGLEQLGAMHPTRPEALGLRLGLGGGRRRAVVPRAPVAGAAVGPVGTLAPITAVAVTVTPVTPVAITTVAALAATSTATGTTPRPTALALTPTLAAVAPTALATVAVGAAPGQLGRDQLVVAAGGGQELEALGLATGERGRGRRPTTSTPSR